MIDFPSNPADGQQVTAGARTWQYDAAGGVWNLVSISDANVNAAQANADAAAVSAAAALAQQVIATAQAAAALTQANAAAASRAAIDNRIYPGTYAVDPVTRPNGTAIQNGDEFQSTSGQRKYRVAGAWVVPGVDMLTLASQDDATKGSDVIGHGGNLNYVAGSIGAAINDVCINVCLFPWLAKGDGITDDTLALRAAITGAGAGRTLIFPSGKTFLHYGRLAPLAGQTWMGYGACLKRANEVTAATATNIALGSPTNITVPNGALFKVGMDVTVFNGASYDPSPHLITAINGNILTVNTAFTVAFPAGGTVVTVGQQVISALARVKMIGLEFDGNRANNATIAKWELHAAIYINGDYSVVRDCYIHDEVSEGIELGGQGSIADSNWIINCGGNGIHFSGSTGGKARGNFVKNVNILGAAPGHADGGIIFSNATGHSMITNNYVDTAISGVASIDSDDNSSVVISGNLILNCTSTAIEGTFPNGTKGGKVTITGNLIYNSVKVELNYTPGFSAGNGPYNWIVADNYLEDTAIYLNAGVHISVHGNILQWLANTAVAMINVTGCQYVTVNDNQITGGGNGIYLASGVGIRASGNLCKNQYQRGINTQSAATIACAVTNNTVVVENGSPTNGSYQAITLGNGWSCKNNEVDVQTVSTAAVIGCPNGGVGVNGAMVTGNTVRSAGPTYAIQCFGGSQNNFVVGNFTQQAVQNSAGASNTVAGNYVIN
jgi:hypothetical protein